MQGYWLHPDNTFSNSMDWVNPPEELPDGVTFVEGYPEGLSAHRFKTPLELMSEVFDSQPIAIRSIFMDLRPAIVMEAELGHWDLVYYKIENIAIPPELEPYRASLLAAIPYTPPQNP